MRTTLSSTRRRAATAMFISCSARSSMARTDPLCRWPSSVRARSRSMIRSCRRTLSKRQQIRLWSIPPSRFCASGRRMSVRSCVSRETSPMPICRGWRRAPTASGTSSFSICTARKSRISSRGDCVSIRFPSMAATRPVRNSLPCAAWIPIRRNSVPPLLSRRSASSNRPSTRRRRRSAGA